VRRASRRPLEQAWRQFVSDVITDATPLEIEHARDVFYAGAAVVASMVDVGDLPSGLVDEIEAYEKLVIERAEKKAN
jgi:hypothetical protein